MKVMHREMVSVPIVSKRDNAILFHRIIFRRNDVPEEFWDIYDSLQEQGSQQIKDLRIYQHNSPDLPKVIIGSHNVYYVIKINDLDTKATTSNATFYITFVGASVTTKHFSRRASR